MFNVQYGPKYSVAGPDNGLRWFGPLDPYWKYPDCDFSRSRIRILIFQMSDPEPKRISNEKDKNLNKSLTAKGGSWNFETIVNISDLATFLPSWNKVMIFFNIKFSIHYV